MKPFQSIVRVGFGALLISSAIAQTLFVPGTITGISGSNVGINTNSPQYTLSFGGAGNRIGFYSDTDHYNSIEFYNSSTGGMIFDHKTAAGGGYVWRYAGSPLVTFLATGNVGIGTTTPQARLDIGTALGAGKGARFGDYLEINERELINNASSIGWNAYVAADNGTYAPTHSPGTGMVLAMSSGGWGELDFYGKNWAGNSTPQNLDSFTPVMHLSTSGNVGIGTTAPEDKLHVMGRAIFQGGQSAIVHRNSSGETIALTGVRNDVAGENNFTFYGYGANWIFHNGNVGIGTTNPTQKLSVAGTVRAKEVIVDTGWSDFVFDEGYKLKALSETEDFIKAEKHLPGIPTASEVAEHGVSVGEMQAKLLAKIEELTLHQIEQEKVIRSQAARIDAVEAENQTLLTKVQSLHTP